MSNIFGQPPRQPIANPFAHLSNPTPAASQTPSIQTSSLFGNLSNPQPQPQQQNQPLQTSSVFASLGSAQPQQPQQGPSLFSNLGTSKLPDKPLGGGDEPSQQQQSTLGGGGGGLFGASQQASSQNPNSSIFAPQVQNLLSGPQETQQQAQNVQILQGPEQQQNGASLNRLGKGLQPVYFNSLLEKGRKRAHDADGQPTFSDLPSLQLGLGDIAKKIRELGGAEAKEQRGNTVDSKAHYLLAASGVNPGTTLRDLSALNAQPPTTGIAQQSADWDPDTNKHINQLQQQSTLKMIAEGVERAQRNFDAYLEENVDINWELQRKKIYEHFGLMHRGNGGSEEFAENSSSGTKGSFGRSTRKGRSTNAGPSGQASLSRSIFGASGIQKSVIGTPGVGAGNATLFADVTEKNGTGPTSQNDRFLREKQLKFAEKVQRLNQARLQESSYPLLEEFSAVEAQPGGESASQLVDAYKALMEMVKDDPSSGNPTNPNTTKERQFADNYLDETPNSVKTINIRKKIINGSRRCLETHFFDQVETLVARNAREANLGGIPTAINKIRAYIRVRAARRDLTPDGTDLQTLDSDYCWALIYFMIRSGLVKEAAEYVTSNATAFKNLDRNFITYITSYASSADRRLPRSIQDRINTEYQQRSRNAPENSLDPYRMACYKIIGRCEISKRNIESISQGVEDWIWLQFSLAREVNRVEESAGDVFGLEEVRDTIREIGQRHFSKGSEGMGGYGTYFFLQILGGMFEQAVSYLYWYSYVGAVHFAIALDFYGLLRVSDFSVSESELLTYNTKDLPQINFGRMLGYYTRDFRAGNVEAAVDYLALICLDANLPGELGKCQTSLCHEALRELVLETREFALLLGDIRSDGTRLKGAIEQRLKLVGLADKQDFLKIVTVQAASIADDNGRTADAVLLYHLAEDYENVIAIVNRALSEAIAVDIGQEQLRLQPLKPRTAAQQGQDQLAGSSLSLTSVDDPMILARNMMSLYETNALYIQKIRPVNRNACGMLLRMGEAKAKVAAGQWAEALDIIDALDLLPLHAQSSIPSIRSHAQSFNALPSTISRNIGPLLLWTITCIGHQREVLQSGQYEGGTRKEMSEDLLTGAKDLMVFAGLVKYRLGERVWEAVTRCGGDVGVY